MIAIYPGSFDPITNGHLDIIERCAKKFDKVIVAVSVNLNKKSAFTIEERVDMIRELLVDSENIEVDSFQGLLVDYTKNKGADVIIRGLRAVSDYEYEMQMSMYNKELYPDIETLFLVARGNYSYLSSSIVKEVAYYGGDITRFVPPSIEEKISAKLKGGL
ncbi:MAG: pantetheine-phosphate adenylyltransferase [Tissierellia bacterium]|nr:pantetheine-phosphate adenylyltransferase [Tissierellia bacterium]